MPRKPTTPKPDAPIEHVPGQEAFPGMGDQPPTHQRAALDDMTPEEFYAGLTPQEARAAQFYAGERQVPRKPQEDMTQVTLLVPGRASPANVLTATLNIVAKAMLADGWAATAISAAMHDQVDATLNPREGFRRTQQVNHGN